MVPESCWNLKAENKNTKKEADINLYFYSLDPAPQFRASETAERRSNQMLNAPCVIAMHDFFISFIMKHCNYIITYQALCGLGITPGGNLVPLFAFS